MAGFLLPDNFLEALSDVEIGRAVAKGCFDVVLVEAEQAGADFAVSGEADAVAVTAESFGDWRDNSDFTAALFESPAAGSFGFVVADDRFEIEFGLEALEDFATRNDQFLEPCSAEVEGHEFDEAEAEVLDRGRTRPGIRVRGHSNRGSRRHLLLRE